MGESFESLEIEISAQANNANAALDGLVKRLQKVSTALLGANGAGLSNLANGVSQLSASMQTMSGVKSTDFNRIAKGISKFGSINSSAIHSAANALVHLVTSLNGIGSVNFDAGSLTNLASAISKLGGIKAGQATSNLPQIKKDLIGFIQGLNGLKTIDFDMTGLSSLVGSISKLGGKAATNAIPNIQNLGIALKGMMQTLATAPKVSQNLIQMTSAMAVLASNGSKVSSATKGVANGLRTYQYATDRAHKSSKNLASSIGMLYAKFWVFMRAFRGLWKSVESSMDYLETVNYFDSAMGQIADNAKETWKQAGFDSAEAYADSFGRRAKELTKKMTGFSIGDDGSLTATNAPNLGLNPEKLLNYQATYAQMASSMGVASGTAMKLSNALTMIGADLASVKNLEFESVWENMASGMVGMSRAVDKYGINLRNTNMQEELYRLGLDMKISKLNQADKAVLRTIMILNASKYAWGDLATTLGSPANQLRMLQAGFANLARTIGGLLLPIVAKVLPYINALVVAIQRLFSWIGGLLGIKIGSLNSSIGGAAVDMGDFADSAEDAAGGLGDAADNAKKLNKQLAGWHELENMTSKEDSSGGGSGAGGAGGGLLDDALNDALADYYAAWDAAFAGMENTVNDMADKVCAAFKRIWDIAEPTREALKRLWNEGLAEFGNFTWTGLKDFWDYFLVPLGKWTLGEGLPRFINITNDFLTSINWSEINYALRNFWQALEPFAENVGMGLIDFYEDLTKIGANFINSTVPSGINKLAEALKKIDPKSAQNIGYGLGIVATGIIGFKTLAPIVRTLESVAKSMKKWNDLKSVFSWLGAVKYVAIAGGIVGLVVALDRFGYIDVNWNTLASAFGKLATALGKFVVGIGKGLISFIDGFLRVMSPALEGLINGAAKALDGLGSVLNAIPERVIDGLTGAFASFFTAWVTYKGIDLVMSNVGKAMDIFKGAYAGLGIIAMQYQQTGSIVSALSYALGPAALGGVQFTAIAGGLLFIAQKMAQVTEEAAKNSAIGQFADAISNLNDEVSQKTDQIQTSLANTRRDIETTGVAETQAAKDLADEYERLSSKAGLSADDKERLRDVSSRLVEIIPGLNGYIDKENGYLDIQKKTLDDLIERQELYAQKQAAQEYLVQAYKNQYEAQMNVNNAQKEYQKYLDEFIEKNPQLSDSVKNMVKEGDTQGLKDLYHDLYEVQGSHRALEEEFGKVPNGKAVLTMIDDLEESTGSYNESIKEAIETQRVAGEEVGFLTDRINENELAIQGLNDKELATKKTTAEFQQTLSDLKGEFFDLGVAVSEEFLDKLALDDTGLADDVIAIFDTLKNQTEISGEELKQIFDRLGFNIPKGFADALSKQSPEVRTSFVSLFANLSAGVPVDAEQLNSAFQTLGYGLPDTFIEALSTKDANVQAKTIELLGMVEGGKKLAEGNLIEVFKNLGVDIVESGLVASLTSETVTAETQQSAINLLAKLIDASDAERGPLIEEYNSLGIGIIDSGLIASLKSKETDVNSAGTNIVKETVSGAITESKRTGSGTVEEAAQNAIDGYVGKLKSVDTKRRLLQTGIEFAQTFVDGIKEGQDSHSPSKATAKLGDYAVDGYVGEISSNKIQSNLFDTGFQMAQRMIHGLQQGQKFDSFSSSMTMLAKNAIQAFNQGLSDDMFPSFRFADQWSNGLVKRFGFQESETWMKNIAEDFGRYQLDPMFTEGLDIDVKFDMASVPKIGDLSSSISMEIQNAISDATYSAAAGILEEMKDAVREGMSEADVKAVMDSDVAFSTMQRKSREFRKQSGRPAFDY